MTKKRYFAVGGLLAVLACVGFGIAMVIPPASGVTNANFCRIEEGMTETEVVAILGKPMLPWSTVAMGVGCTRFGSWENEDKSRIDIVLFNDTVGRKTWTPSGENVIEKLRRWLRL